MPGVPSISVLKHTVLVAFLLLCAALQGACSKQAVYTRESFANDSPFKVRVDDELDADAG